METVENLADALFIREAQDQEYDYGVLNDIGNYLRQIDVDIAFESVNGSYVASVGGERINLIEGAHLYGTLILAQQAALDNEDIVMICDAINSDLGVVSFDLEREGILEDLNDGYRNIFYIDTIELSTEVIESEKLRDFFDLIPSLIFQLTGIKPQITCYMVNAHEGYYEKKALRTKFDPRSVDERSVKILSRNGYCLTQSGQMLYMDHDEWNCFSNFDFGENEVPDNQVQVQEKENSLGFDIQDDISIDDQNSFDLCSIDTVLNPGSLDVSHDTNRALLENYISIGRGPYCIHVHRDTSNRVKEYLQAALVAYHMGTSLDFALDRFVSNTDPSIPEIHDAFQELYFAGVEHMNNTKGRSDLADASGFGELYSEVALCRARNTYYVAALLYREGHMIEANAMSRLMLEQIAWAFSANNADSIDAANDLKPTKAIGHLRKKIAPVGALYGTLSEYVHLPLKGHYLFLNISDERTKTIYQFGGHSYAFGTILSRLADYWSCVYEYTQSCRFSHLDNWITDSDDLVLNPERPFLKTIEPLKERLKAVYERDYPSFGEFINNNWRSDES